MLCVDLKTYTSIIIKFLNYAVYISANEVVKIIWNDEDEKLLQKCVEKNLTWEEIAQILHRSKYSVVGKSRIMGLVKNRRSSKVGAYTKLENIDTIQICLNCPKIECDNCLKKLI